MRILLASDHYPPFIGGAHRQSGLLAAGLVERGHEVAVAAPWFEGAEATDASDGVVVHRIRQLRTLWGLPKVPGAQQHQPPFPDPISVFSLRKVIRDFNPDLAHSYGWMSYSIACALLGRSTPLLISARDYGYFCPTRTLLRKGRPCSGPAPLKCAVCATDYYGAPKGLVSTAGVFFGKPLLRRKMTDLHSVSRYVEDVTTRYLLAGHGEKADRLHRVTIPSFQSVDSGPPSVDTDSLRPWLHALPSEPYILYVGAFRRVKGLETLFDAYRRLSSPPPLVLIGTFERDSPGDFPPEAIVIENAPNEAVMAAWEGALFGVLPSLWPEPYGSTVAEAMNRGRPVIGTTPGGHVDIIGDDAGLLVPPGDDAALAEAMNTLIADEELRERLAAAARARAEKLVAPVVVPRFESAYRVAVGAEPPESGAGGELERDQR